MTAPREEVLKAWALYDAGERMNDEQKRLLETDTEGNRIIPPSAAELNLKEHGHKPATVRMVSELCEDIGKMVGEQLKPMRRRIAALEAEVRAGHERIKQLEAEVRAGHEGIELMEAGHEDR